MNSVESFMERLKSQLPKTKEDFKQKNKTLEKIYLNYPGNFGRYQVLPMNNAITNYPFVTLFGTREVQIPRKNVTSDGTENTYNAWIKILPKDAYQMFEPSTGRVVSSLTAADDQLLSQAYMIYDQLSTELDAQNQRDAYITSLIRKRNYTVFHGHCMNKWDATDPRNPSRTLFSGLFVITAKGFVGSVQSNIEETSVMEGNDLSWIDQVYNNKLTDREGFLVFSIGMNPNQAGYLVTATHKFGAGKSLAGVSIPEEDAELMQDPVASFMGWQAQGGQDSVPVTERRLFNASLIQEAITFMSAQLASIRMAKSTGMDIAEAISLTTAQALSEQTATTTTGAPTNDPILAKMASEAASSTFSADAIESNNTSPFQTPPTAHIDPMSSAPVAGNAAPFTKPDFASDFNSGSGSDDLPF